MKPTQEEDMTNLTDDEKIDAILSEARKKAEECNLELMAFVTTKEDDGKVGIMVHGHRQNLVNSFVTAIRGQKAFGAIAFQAMGIVMAEHVEKKDSR